LQVARSYFLTILCRQIIGEQSASNKSTVKLHFRV